MPRIGYDASHEQLAPSELLRLVGLAESAGFDRAMSSDHFRPWGQAQGQSGFTWSWLGAALQSTRLPFGVISAPGYRHHDTAARFVRPEDVRESVLISSDFGQHAAWLAEYAGLGFSELQLHQVGRNQEAFGARVLPQLRA